jgi:hypothetical protein
MTPNFRVPRALTVFVMALAASAGLAACKSLTRPSAQTENSTDTVTAYAFNGTPLESPSGLWFFGRQAVPFTAAFSFDVAFDINAQGQATLYTVRYVAGDLSGAHSVGIQKYNGTYEALDKAPTTNYVNDSLYTVNVGDVFAIQTSDPNACAFSVYSNVLYAKLQVLGVDPGTRTVRTRFTVDPNCGFFSLIPSGIPKD